jgi:hypothetical protein
MATRSFLVSVVLVLAVAAARPATASAASTRSLCADTVSVWDSPGGFVIAHMFRPQTLRLLATADAHRWSLVYFTRAHLRGWVLSSAICR